METALRAHETLFFGGSGGGEVAEKLGGILEGKKRQKAYIMQKWRILSSSGGKMALPWVEERLPGGGEDGSF